ncbi:hypothetical protein H4J56_15015 [Colwellia sp. BRX8-4]|uniref:hypothetical protein n=1 Tax=Colwellia sp. BRX8-4 TaxID=2759836 RepID=UPI0015F61205|nr:hypothetical protein [Colwellia sp. BRX8-4]MBA6372732.1 hypothetical protein [Colwellia sp. BRX8-4]
MSWIKELPKLTVFIQKNNGEHMGSGVLIKNENNFYVLTAAHVLFGESNQSENESNFKFISEAYGELTVDANSKSFSRNDSIDAFAVKICSTCILESYPRLLFTADHDFPGLKFCFRGKAKSDSGNPYTVYNSSINGFVGGVIQVKIPPEDYTDYKGETGSEVLQGYSGSGLVISNHSALFLSGIVCSVSNDNFSGVNCVCISDVKSKLLNDLDVIDLKNTVDLVRLDVKNIRTDLSKEIISLAKETNNIAIKNLTRKMDLFLPGWDEDDLESFVSDMLIWDELYQTKVVGNPKFKELIEDSKCELSSGNKKFFVSSAKEGNVKFHEIQTEFKSIVSSFFTEHKLWGKYISTVSSGEIAKYLANCKLDFRD